MSEKMQRLMQRNQERMAKQAADRQARQHDRDQLDQADGLTEFQQNLERSVEQVRSAIDNQQLEDAQHHLRSLNSLLSTSSSALASYTVKQIQQTIDGLDKEIIQKMSLAQPRKRFSFKSVQKQENSVEHEGPSVADVQEGCVDALDTLLSERLSLNDVTIQNRCGERYYRNDAGDKPVNSITITEIKSSVISITHRISSLRIISVRDSLIMVAPVAGSVYIENCINCTLVFAARQIRIHKTQDVHIYMFAKSNPIIEDCRRIAVAPFNLLDEGVEEGLQRDGLTGCNMFNQVQDFHWLRDGDALNWSLLPESQRVLQFRSDTDTLLLPKSGIVKGLRPLNSAKVLCLMVCQVGGPSLSPSHCACALINFHSLQAFVDLLIPMAGSRSRLLKEYREVVHEARRGRSQHQHDQIIIYPSDPDDMKRWTAFVRGPDATPYHDRFFELRIDIPLSYPLEAPHIKFVTPIFHPNIHFKTGEICLDILKHEWSPAWTLTTACRAIVAMLAHPEPESPLNCNAGNLLRDDDQLGFESLARMYVIDHSLKEVPDVAIPYGK